MSRRPPAAAGAIRALALAGALGLAGRPAAGQALGTLSIDDVRVDGHGRHRVLVSALDRDGAPIGGLATAFRATVDGAAAPAVDASPERTVARRAEVYLVIDASLLARETVDGVRAAVEELGRGLEPGDRIHVLAAGARIQRRDAPASRAAALGGQLSKLAADDRPPLYDALYAAARDAAHRGPADAAAILLVTRGVDGDSRRRLIDVLALADDRATPVAITLVGNEGSAAEVDRLQRLAEHTAGSLERVTDAEDLGGTLRPEVERALQRWVLRFDDPGWDRRAPRHRLVVTVEAAGQHRTAALDYETATVLPAPWWRSPAPWAIAAVILAAGVVVLLASRRRQLCLLVHDGDAHDGVWYEVFGLPLALGGAAGNDVVFEDPRVSRHHALLERRGKQIELVDLNSENGTFVNGERVSRRVLVDGDQVSLGREVHLLFEARG